MVSIFGRSKADVEPIPRKELVELDWEHAHGAGEMVLKVMGVDRFADIDNVLDALRTKSSIVVMKVQPKLFSDKVELRRAVRRVQKTTYAIGGDIVGLSEELIVVTPPGIAIDRSTSKKPAE